MSKGAKRHQKSTKNRQKASKSVTKGDKKRQKSAKKHQKVSKKCQKRRFECTLKHWRVERVKLSKKFRSHKNIEKGEKSTFPQRVTILQIYSFQQPYTNYNSYFTLSLKDFELQ